MKTINSFKLQQALAKIQEPSRYIPMAIVGAGMCFATVTLFILISSVFSTGRIDQASGIPSLTKQLNELNRLGNQSLSQSLYALNQDDYDLSLISKTLRTLNDSAASLIDDTLLNSPVYDDIAQPLDAYLQLIVGTSLSLQAHLNSLDHYRDAKRRLPISKKALLVYIDAQESDAKRAARAIVNQLYGEMISVLASNNKGFYADAWIQNIDHYSSRLESSVVPGHQSNSFIALCKSVIHFKMAAEQIGEQKLMEPVHAHYSKLHSLLLAVEGRAFDQIITSKAHTFSNVMVFIMLITSLTTFFALFHALNKALDRAGSKREPSRARVEPEKAHSTKQVKVTQQSKEKEKIRRREYESVEEFAAVFSKHLSIPVKRLSTSVESLVPIIESVYEATSKINDAEYDSVDKKAICSVLGDPKIKEFPFITSTLRESVSMIDLLLKNVCLLSKGGVRQRENLDINNVVREAFSLKGPDIESTCRSILSLDELVGVVQGVSSDLVLALTFLIDNAIDAVKENDGTDGEIEVSTIIDAESVKVFVKDSGVGISGDLSKKIFDPFFTTKSDSTNLGIGLTLAKRYIERHRGRIDIVKGIGKGSVVRVSLPILKRSKITVPAQPPIAQIVPVASANSHPDEKTLKLLSSV